MSNNLEYKYLKYKEKYIELKGGSKEENMKKTILEMLKNILNDTDEENEIKSNIDNLITKSDITLDDYNQMIKEIKTNNIESDNKCIKLFLEENNILEKTRSNLEELKKKITDKKINEIKDNNKNIDEKHEKIINNINKNKNEITKLQNDVKDNEDNLNFYKNKKTQLMEIHNELKKKLDSDKLKKYTQFNLTKFVGKGFNNILSVFSDKENSKEEVEKLKKELNDIEKDLKEFLEVNQKYNENLELIMKNDEDLSNLNDNQIQKISKHNEVEKYTTKLQKISVKLKVEKKHNLHKHKKLVKHNKDEVKKINKEIVNIDNKINLN